MSSTLIPVPAAKLLGRRTESYTGLLSTAAVALAAWLLALKAVHAGAHLSAQLYSLGLVLIFGTSLSSGPATAYHSPLNIHRTARSLQSIAAAVGIVLAYRVLFPQTREVATYALIAFSILKMLVDPLRAERTQTSHEIVPALQSKAFRLYPFIKRFLDVTSATAILVVTSPLLALIAALIAIDSPGGVFFSQQRVGLCGQRFRIFKFRSMHLETLAYERSPVNSRDPRITRVGRVLRRLGLDELPQLINVLLGDMSLVGPRPEMPFIVSSYTAHEGARLSAVPGITGLWQISPARARPIHENVHLDLYYIANCSFFLDLAILCRTVTVVIRGNGAV